MDFRFLRKRRVFIVSYTFCPLKTQTNNADLPHPNASHNLELSLI
jgi:hypothetical protein